MTAGEGGIAGASGSGTGGRSGMRASVSGAPAALESRGLRLAGYHDLDGRPGFKLAMQEVSGRWFLYLAHLWHSGWSVLDVTEPAAPRLLRTLEGPPDTWTIQVQVADGLMITALERPSPGWGYDPAGTRDVGILIWDVSEDPTHPRRVAHYDTGGRGTHRNFYAGGRYAYLAAEPEGYRGNILVVLDVADPAHPAEVGRWWWPGQWLAGGETPEYQHYLHGPAYVVGERAYLGYGRVGMVILDVSAPEKPRLLSRVSFGDFGSILGCHSAVPYGADLVIANSEAIAESAAEPLNYAVTVDVADPEAPRITGWLPAPRPSAGLPYTSYADKGGRIGPHNQHHYQGQSCLWPADSDVYMTYFNAGLRVYDVSDRTRPVESAFFVPTDPRERRGPKPHNALVTQFEDVLVDRRGYAYCTDKNHGLLILERDG